VDYRAFITTVEREAGISEHEEAQRAACLTLHTLAQRISGGEVEDLAEKLPGELRPCMKSEGPAQRFHVDEFIDRIESELPTDHATAERAARGVFVALRNAVGRDEFEDMRAQLPDDFAPLLADSEPESSEAGAVPGQPPPVTIEDILDRVGQRTGLDREAARRTVEAFLEVLASRITAGQVEDLQSVVPRELRPALERGRRSGTGTGVRMSLEEFLDRFALLAGIDQEKASRHAGAVLNVLRELVGIKEWHDTLAQLPDEYRTLLRQG
jgi:uncharacterized protein (DUF2267 family)